MKQIGLLGVGSHCRNEHLPALRHLKETRGEDFNLRAVCDLDRNAAEQVAADLGFEQVYDNLDRMLAEAGLDGLIAVTPTSLTCSLTCSILEAGIPVLMEKPLGASLEEAEELVACATRTQTPVMVGMNRRHDPVMKQVAAWIQEHRPSYARAVIHRQFRKEQGFIEDAALHLVDELCALLGPGTLDQVIQVSPGLAESGLATLSFPHSTALVEMLPACGGWEESYLFTGEGFLIHAVPQKEALLRIHKGGKTLFQAPEAAAGRWTTGETEAFFDALLDRAPWTPSPAEVLDSMRLTHAISQEIVL